MRVCFAANNDISNCCLIKQVLSGSERGAKHALKLFLFFPGAFIVNVSEVGNKVKCILFNLCISTIIVFNEL